MQIAPVTAVAPFVQTPLVPPVRPAALPSPDTTTQFVLDGPSGLLVQSYGALAVISSAALVMVLVFAIFAFVGLPSVKEIGVGLAVAIFLDATVVRLVLVPATMELLGDRNWWLPGWLDRALPDVDFEGRAAAPSARYAGRSN